MGGKASRVKGHGMEREAAIALREIFPNAQRLLEYQEGFGIDLQNTGRYDIQCKAYKKYVSMNTYHEIPKKPGRVPVLVAKGDRQPWLVTLSFSDFKELLCLIESKKLS
jgi:hypothetical protein